MNKKPRLLTVSELVEEIGYCERTIYRWVRKYGMPHERERKPRGQMLFNLPVVKRWMEDEAWKQKQPG